MREPVRQTYEYGFQYVAGAFRDRLTRKQLTSSNVGIVDTQYEYDRLGRLSNVTDTDSLAGTTSPQVATKSVNFGYDLASNLSQVARSSGAATTLGYDKADRLTSVTHDLATDIVHTFAYDNASRVTSFNTASTTRNYGYDDAGQLTGSTGYTNESYGYDDNGNRTLVGGQSIVTSLANRLTDDGTYTYLYDTEGNLTRRTLKDDPALTTEYVWDYRNRLAQVLEKSGTSVLWQIHYTYDAEGRRVKDSGGFFVYDGSDLAMTFNNAQQLEHRYLYGPLTDQVLVDEVFDAAGQSQDTLWLLADHQGTIRDIADSNGVARKHIDYDSFGNAGISLIAGPRYFDASGQEIEGMEPWASSEAVAVDQLFGYTGQEWDEDTKLYNYNARWYNPSVGRFLSEDPSGFDGGDPNLYRYVGNSPLSGTDPTGLRQAGNPLANLPIPGVPAFNPLPFVAPSFTNFSITAAPPVNFAAGLSSQHSTVNSFGTADYLRTIGLPTLDQSLQQAVRTPTSFGSLSPAQVFQPGRNEVVSVQKIGGERAGDSYRLGADQLARRFETNAPLDRLLYSAIKVIGYSEGALVDSFLPASDPGYLVTRRDGSRTYHMGEGPTSGGLANQALLFGPPGLSAQSRQAGQLSWRAERIAPTTIQLSEAPFDAAYRARLGIASSNDYKNTFFSAYPELEGRVVVHHAVEQQTLTRFRKVVTEVEIHSLENLRGVPVKLNTELHLTQIRKEWNNFYRQNPTPTKQQLLQKATQIDFKYGKQFTPPVGRISL